MDDDSRLVRANALYERAVFGGDAEALPAADRELDGVEADLSLARGRVLHARFLAAWQDDISRCDQRRRRPRSCADRLVATGRSAHDRLVRAYCGRSLLVTTAGT